MRWIVVSATQDEARGVPRDHPGVADVVIVGVGKVAASAALAYRLAHADPDVLGVLNVGTAGALRDGVTGIVRPSSAWAWDFDAAAIRALGVHADDEVPLAGGDGSVIASGDAFVADGARRAGLAARASIVDMESYAVAWAARARGFRVEAVKWVSDSADESAPRDWPSVLERGAREIGGYVAGMLDR
jgi:adenosylhomocysteine nucleosidase